MQYILLSGGSGKRLWPLSNDVQSKQFIKLFKKNDGTSESMLERIYSQITSVDFDAKILIATAKSQVPIIKNQLGENVSISIEPSRKDTFAAIILASLFLKDKQNIDLGEVITVCPVDPFVESSYFKRILELQKIVKDNDINIGLLGINPTYPSAKYGYIVTEKVENKEFFKVNQFIEKPSESEAEELIKKGALWNGGVFCFKLKYIIEFVKQNLNYTNYKDLFDNYHKIEKISFDYKVVEKEKNIVALKYEGEWKDIGTWNTFTEAINDTNIGNVIIDDKSINTNVINELNIPVIAMGLKNIVVAASHDGIFVSDKKESSYNKKLVDKLDNRPMYEERSWGNFKIVDINSNSLTKHITINKGKSLSYQCHRFRDETWTIISGIGIFVLDGYEKTVKEGDVLVIKRGQKHTIRAMEELHFIEVQIGEYLSEDDCEKYGY